MALIFKLIAVALWLGTVGTAVVLQSVSVAVAAAYGVVCTLGMIAALGARRPRAVLIWPALYAVLLLPTVYLIARMMLRAIAVFPGAKSFQEEAFSVVFALFCALYLVGFVLFAARLVLRFLRPAAAA